jgi:hypothetical protein
MSNHNQEIATYTRHLPELLGHQDKFVLIKRSDLVRIFDLYQDALTAGYQRFASARMTSTYQATVSRVA